VFASMDRDWLAGRLESGHSIEAIAAEVGRHPSTVAYWVNKHGLRSSHADRLAARGGIPRDRLAALVAEGLSIRAIATRLDRSTATVRHWLKRYGLSTRPARARVRYEAGLDGDSAAKGAPGLVGDEALVGECPRHGRTRFHRIGAGGRIRCARCNAEAVVGRRKRIKALLIAEAAGACRLCGYARCPSALHFHHLDPRTKTFHVSQEGATRSLATARAEAAKCVLLCANCHAEVEAGVATLAMAAPEFAPG
jgi:transposase